MRLLLSQLILVSCREKDTWRDFVNEEVDQIKTFFEGIKKSYEFMCSIEFSDLDDLDKYMLELHRKDRQFTDLVPEPDAVNDQERFFFSILDAKY